MKFTAEFSKFLLDITTTKRYHGLRYGQAFCKAFGLTNDKLIQEKNKTVAILMIYKSYPSLVFKEKQK